MTLLVMPARALAGAIVFLALSPASTQANVGAEKFALQTDLDHVWTMIAAALVFLMQAGFLLLEAGQVRSKNSVNVAQKNLIDFVLSTVAFGAIGFTLMFGTSVGGYVGYDPDMFFFGITEDWSMTFFVFQLVFCGTAATVVSGAVAERMTLFGYILTTLMIALVIYPVAGHWAWGGLLSGDDAPFLAAMGFMDFAGGTVVHLTGASVALAAIIVIGPRYGKFDENGQPRKLHGHSPVLATLGAILIWIGWIGFNGGSTTAGTSAFAVIVMNTMAAAAGGGMMNLLLGRVNAGIFRPEHCINGVLGGLVAITAGCDVLDPRTAFFVGVSAGLVVYGFEWALEHIAKLDDPLGAIAVHGAAGVWGTVMTGALGPVDSLLAGSRMDQVTVQLFGAGVVFVWAFGVSFLVMKLFDVVLAGPEPGHGLRVSEEDERIGLNVAEHDAPMGSDVLKGALASVAFNPESAFAEIEIDHGDEAFETAQLYNMIVQNEREKRRKDAENRLAMEREVAEVIAACARGDFTQRLETDNKDGFFKEVSTGINGLCDATLNGFDSVSGIVAALARGDFSKRMDGAYKGTLGALQKNLNLAMDDLSGAIDQVTGAVKAAAQGDFSVRVNAGEVQGSIRALCDGFDDICSATDQSLGDVAGVMNALARGNLDAEMTKHYSGAFAEIQMAVNSTLNQLSDAIDDVDAAVTSASAGNFRHEVDMGDRQGFLRRLGDGVNAICGTSKRGLEDINSVLERMANGDLTGAMADTYDGQFAEVSAAMNATGSALRSMIAELSAAARDVAGIAAETSAASDQLRHQAEKQTTQIASAKEALASIDEAATLGREMSENARVQCDTARQEAEMGHGIATKASGQMDAIASAAKHISKAVDEISQIAFQTHLLSLNASVEAARGGGQEAFGGFTVIAEEIRSLAANAQSAAKDIRTRTDVVVGSVTEGQQLVGEVGAALDRIVGSVSAGTRNVAELADKSVAQARLVSDVRTRMEETEQQTRASLDLAKSTHLAADRLTKSSASTLAMLSRFRVAPELEAAA